MISIYMKNRPWTGNPRCDYVRVISREPDRIVGYRIDGARLAEEAVAPGYLDRFGGWYHPATAWEIEEYRRLGGLL
ncbi:MAG: hypothetical protein ABSG17_13090 [Spirochaetia bacterium]|jgi:hypothetical protein